MRARPGPTQKLWKNRVCVRAADVDDDGEVSVTDAIYLLNFLFLDQAAPESPFPFCGPDVFDDVFGPCNYLEPLCK